MKATLYTIIALIAFAANSLFCRMALAEGYIDAWSFTIIRLLGGAVCLMLIMTVHARRLTRQSMVNKNLDNRAILKDKGSWLSSISLVIYALCFSLAYVELDTGTGALILFAAVQLTMIGWGIFKRAVERLSVGSFCGGSSRLYLSDATLSCCTIVIWRSNYGYQRRCLGCI